MNFSLLSLLLLPSFAQASAAVSWNCSAVLKNEDGCQIPGFSAKISSFQDGKVVVEGLVLTDPFLQQTAPASRTLFESPEVPVSGQAPASLVALNERFSLQIPSESGLDASWVQDGVIYSAVCRPANP